MDAVEEYVNDIMKVPVNLADINKDVMSMIRYFWNKYSTRDMDTSWITIVGTVWKMSKDYACCFYSRGKVCYQNIN